MKHLPLFLTLVFAFTGSTLPAQAVELMVFDQPATHTIALAGQDEVEVRLKGLLPGEAFALYLQQDPTYPAVVYTHIPESVTEYGTIEMKGKSDGKPVVFCLDVLAKNLKAIDLRVLKNPKVFASTLSKFVGDTIETEANDDVEFLLNNVFRKDTCFTLFPGEIRSNPRNIPRPGSQTGIFRNGGPTVGIDSGIIISTGFIEAAPGPNDFAIAQQGVIDFLPMNDSFPDAERLVPPGEFIHDVVILEFDFIPTTDTISFDYVFFSEQYCQSGNGVTNDAFGFLLSGPLGNDINIARLPVSGDIVSPATLNPSTVDAASFLHNTDPSFDNPCFPFPPPPERFAGIAYDGFSVPLTAVGRVVPCARHTLKIVLLDAGDFLSDSGILLEAGSFLAGLVNKPEPNTTAEVGSLTPVEGCDEASIAFTRRTLTPEALSEPLFVKYNIIPYFGTGGIDPATRGITGASSDTADYILPVSPFVIPPGDTSGILRIPILLDGVDENIEAFIVRYDGTCDCTENADTFYIRDNRDFDIDLGPDLSACAGTEIVLTASPGGGNGDFTYNWPDPAVGDTNRVTYIATGRDTTINLTILDGCGLEGTGSVTISAPNITADVGGFYSLCSNPVAMVNLDVGGTPSSFYDIVVRVDSNGVVTDIPIRILGDTIFEFTRSADFSIVSVTDDTGCSGFGGNDVARIRSSSISDTSRVVQPNCNQPIGSIDVLLLDGNTNYAFRWLDGSGSTATSRSALTPGVYEVELTPDFDMACLDTLRFALTGPPALEIDTIRTFIGGIEDIPACPGQTVDLVPFIRGGTLPYTFSWPDSISTDSILSVVTQTGRTVYPFVVTDDCDESVLDSVVIDLPDFSVALGGRYSLCDVDTVAVPLIISGPAGSYTVEVHIDSAGFLTTRFLIRSPGSSELLFDYAATITAVGITNTSLCPGDTISGMATVVDPQISFNAAVENIRCNGEATGSITLTNASNVPVVYDWSDIGPGPATRTGLAAATYSLRIRDAEAPSCFRDTSFVLSEPPAFSVSISSTGTACPFAVDTLTAAVSGGTPPYTYLWADSLVTDSLLPVTTLAGITSYRIMATDDCGVVAEAFFDHDFPDLRAAVSGTYGVCNAPFNVDVPFTLSGSSNYTVVIRENGVERTLTETGDFSINYTSATLIELLSVAGADNCSLTLTDTASVIDNNFVVEGNPANVSCRGDADGSLDLDVNGDSGAYTFAWSAAGLSGPNPTGLIAGTYFVTITDTLPSACFLEASFIIDEPAMLVVDAQNQPVLCPGDVVNLFALVSGGTGPYAFDWENGTSADSLYLATTTGGTTRYPLLVTDFCGLSVRDTVTIVLNDLRAEVSGSYSVCNPPNLADVPVTFTGDGPFTFVVRENGVNRTLVATQDTLLRYTEATEIQLISVTDGNNCSGIAGGIANVTDAVFSVVSQIENVLCANAATGAISLTVNGNNAAYDFSWGQPGLSGPAVSELRVGIYDLTVTDRTPFGCTWDTTFFVLEPASAIVLNRDSVRDERCSELAYAAATYTGGTGQLTYSWSNGTSGTVLGEVPAGIYTLSVTDENLCEVTQVFNLQDRRSTLQAGIQTSGTALSCNVREITLSATQQTQVVTYAWSDQNDNDLGASRGIMITEPGRYFVTLTNPANGCSATDSIDIGRDGDLLDLVIPAEYAITCNDNAVDLAVIHPDFTGTVSYEWRFNGTLVGNDAALSNISALGTYEVTVIRADNGCLTVITTEVIMDRSVPNIVLDAPAVTSNCRAPEVSIGVGTGGPYTYAWSTANGSITGPVNVSRTTADRPGLYTVILTDTLNGCTSQANVTVINDGITLTPNAGPDQVLVCTGAGTVLSGSASPSLNGTEVRWYAPDGSIIGKDLQVTTVDPGQHVFEAIHPISGCSSFDTVLVNSEAPGSVSYSLQQPPCPEVGGRLFVTEVTGLHGPYSYSSPTGVPEPFGTGLRGLRVGTNVLIVTDQLGCELRDTFQIFPGNTLDGEAEDVVIRLGEEATLGVTTNRTDGQLVSWKWRNLNDSLACLNCPDPRVSPLESFIAEVTVIDSNGCAITLRQNVIVEEAELIYMPSAFSPNGDGMNDIYTVFGSEEFVDGINFLRIFDRWGNLVFSNENFQVNDPDAGWKGISPDGRIFQNAVYIYSVSYNRWDGEAVVKQGGFTLVK